MNHRRYAIGCGRPLRRILVVLASLYAAAAMAAGQFDGVYTGVGTLSPGSNTICNPIYQPTITITDNKLTFIYNQVVAKNIATITTDLASDGSFRGSALRRTRGEPMVQELSGQVKSAGIEADTGAAYCNYHLSLKKN